jgi:acyl-CoA synthetase (AMP-forming)/AMP-acid ligase II
MTELSHFGGYTERLRRLMTGHAPTALPSAGVDQLRTDCPALSATVTFEALALELFGLQFNHNPAYHAFCQNRGVNPDDINHWQDIPALPTAAFKEFEISSLPPHERTTVFYSSGTTGQSPSRHFHNHESLSIYEASLWQWFSTNLLTDLSGQQLISGRTNHHPFGSLALLSPPPQRSANSSLVHMFETIRVRLDAQRSAFLCAADEQGAWQVESRRGIEFLEAAVRRREPVLILATAFTLVHLLDTMSEQDLRLSLPAGSFLMETGGYKGRSRMLPKEELHSMATFRLGIPAGGIFCEYGMSELSSQAYDTPARDAAASARVNTASGPVRFPPWARVQIVSPETGREVEDGQTGLIRVYDLANVYSAMAVQTEDMAIRRGDGFELLGRVALAEPRGCSLMSQ